MRARAQLIVLLCLAAALPAAEGEARQRLAFPDGGALTLAHPAAWRFKATPPHPSQPPSVTLTGSSGGAVSLQLTFIAAGGRPLATQEQVDQLLQAVSGPYAEGSLEQRTTIEHLACRQGLGSCARYTDADLAGKPPQPGQFRVVASGVVVYGPRRAIFTLLADTFTQAGFTEALRVVTDGISVE